ncbi:hypothetical protein CLAIMM_04459 [Cladophialophora immunda]|nr:hypothetical protein CLAIMM_04459 [Cladophialophora immunda]
MLSARVLPMQQQAKLMRDGRRLDVSRASSAEETDRRRLQWQAEDDLWPSSVLISGRCDRRHCPLRSVVVAKFHRFWMHEPCFSCVRLASQSEVFGSNSDRSGAIPSPRSFVNS